MRVELLQPSASPRQLLELIELHLETLKLKGEVDRVELRAAVVGRLGQRVDVRARPMGPKLGVSLKTNSTRPSRGSPGPMPPTRSTRGSPD